MPRSAKKPIQLIANGDLRLTANQKCWPAQEAMEKALAAYVNKPIVRIHTGDMHLPTNPKGNARQEVLEEALAADLQRDNTIIGVFDEGCMCMYNAIIPDELLHKTGVFKERLSQSALYYQ